MGPDIPKLSGVTLPLVQQAVDRIRERFARLEAEVAATNKVASTTQTKTAADIQRQVSLLRAEVAALAALVGASDDDLSPAARRPKAEEDDLAAPARRSPPQADDDLGPAGVSRAALLALADRIDAIEQEPLR
jgi:hypothetical protein